MILNNLAELRPVKINSTELQQHWEEQKNHFNNIGVTFQPLVTYYSGDVNDFIPYYRSILVNLIEVIDLPHSKIVVLENSAKMHVSNIHRDFRRKTCMTIPVFAQEPVQFYESVDESIERQSSGTSMPVTQTGYYSKEHPTLVNVSNLHRLVYLSKDFTRVLIQVNYDYSFEEIIEHKPDVWKIIE